MRPHGNGSGSPYCPTPPAGEPGKSAYEIAVAHGYRGSEAEWIAYVEANGAEAKAAEEAARSAETGAKAARGEAEGLRDEAASKAAEAGAKATSAAQSASEARAAASEASSSGEMAEQNSQAASRYRNEAQTARDEAAEQAQRATERADEARQSQIDTKTSEVHCEEMYAEIMRAPKAVEEYAQIAAAASAAATNSANSAALSAQSAASSLDDINIGLASKLGKNETAKDSERVNGLEVKTAVPENAVFTDTTYDNMTASEASTGTGTTGRVISAKVLADFVNSVIETLVASAPGTLDTLKELADAIGNDPNFATTMVTALAGKLGKTETAVNAQKVNDHTVNSDVPAGAVFTDTTYSNATTSTAGLMSSADKIKLNGIESGAQVNTITGVKGNSESTYRTGNVNITKANIGLGNVDNTADANKSVSYANNAGTVNNLTVQTAVPANAVFTDTTYSAMSASEATTGTATTARTITAKVLADYVAACIANLVNSAPAALDTLQELADALGNDPNFATTMTNALAEKLGKNETAKNAEKVNNLTVQTAVPANAKFTDTTYSNFVKSGSGAKAGLVPAPSTTAGTTKYLREDGTWQVPPDNNTTYTAASATPLANGTAAVGTSAKYAREDHVHPLQTSVSGSSGSCTGNAATATTATGDKNGNDITETYLPLAGGTMTGNLFITKDMPQISVRNNNYQRGTAPEATYSNPFFMVKQYNNGQFATFEHIYDTDMSNKIVLRVYPGNVSGHGSSTKLTIGYDGNGNPYTGAPSPANNDDNSTKIATTAWIRRATGNTNLNAATATRATYDENGVRISTFYAPQAQVDYLADVATNSVSAAVSAKNDAETAKNQAQSIADGLASIRDTAVDTSLSINGQAADSKTVGDKFAVIGATSATNNEYLCVWLDSANRVLFGVKADGSFYWQKGIPKPIKDELDAIKSRLEALES